MNDYQDLQRRYDALLSVEEKFLLYSKTISGFFIAMFASPLLIIVLEDYIDFPSQIIILGFAGPITAIFILTILLKRFKLTV